MSDTNIPADPRFSNGLIVFEGVKAGDFHVDRVTLGCRQAAINFHECIVAGLENAANKRAYKSGSRRPQPLPMGAPARPLETEISDYLRDMERRNLNPKTIEVTARTLKLLVLTCGNISAARIDYKDIHKMWELLRWAPKNVTTDPLLSKLSFEEVIEAGRKMGTEPLAPATLERHRRFLVSFFRHLEDSLAIPSSPMRAFKKPAEDDTVRPASPARYFEDENLQSIFNWETFIPWATKPQLWWAPMIGLFTGARVNEVCQLKIADIVDLAGQWCFSLQKTEDEDLAKNPRLKRTSRQSMKGKGCTRIIPIAQPLLDAGILDYVGDVRATGHRRLFPHLSAGTNRRTGETNAHYSQTLVAEFGRYMKTLGFGRGIGFHAFRHTLVTNLSASGASHSDIALLTGHAPRQIDVVPVLDKFYQHREAIAHLRGKATTLARYQPPVQLPVYQRGQFGDLLADPSKFHP